MLNTKLAPKESKAVEFADVLLHELQFVKLRKRYLESSPPIPELANGHCGECATDAIRVAAVEACVAKIEASRRLLLSDCATNDAHDTLLSRYGEARSEARREALTGLAFSGGGIRSATFNLGVIQGLASLGLLKRFDYLSTVSGGGYIGSWLAAWIKREGDPTNVENQLHPSHATHAETRRLLRKEAIVDEEPEPVYHLRAHSNYLTPKLGIVSADTWTLIAIYIRNLLLNLLFLVPLASLLVLAAYGLLHLFAWLRSWGEVWLVFAALGPAAFGFWMLGVRIRPKLKRAPDVQ